MIVVSPILFMLMFTVPFAVGGDLGAAIAIGLAAAFLMCMASE